MGTDKCIAVAWGVRISPRDRRQISKTHGVETEVPKNGLGRHLGVSRPMLCKDKEDTCASEDAFPVQTFLGAKARRGRKTFPEHAALAKTSPAVKPRRC